MAGGNGTTDPSMGIIQKITEHYKSVKFGSGVIGKTSYVSFGTVVMWTVIAFRLSNDVIFDLFLVGCGLIATAFATWTISSTQNFAQRNPAQAILEGADFIEYQKFEAQAKGGILLGSTNRTGAPGVNQSSSTTSELINE